MNLPLTVLSPIWKSFIDEMNDSTLIDFFRIPLDFVRFFLSTETFLSCDDLLNLFYLF